jgi:tRNA(Ile)-lysidine synthase
VSTPPCVAVATSGGRDSTALLHSTLRCARELGVQVWALHVHHGLMPQADAWLAQVRSQARRWGASFAATRLEGAPASGQSVEAWARVQRYRALAEMAHAAGCSLVLLAHHRRDQAETWLLQALRGAGHLGLASMPRVAQRHGITWARPWLDRPRELIDAYARRHRLRVVDDPSNADVRFARSRLRTQAWPALSGAFPDAEAQLAQAARHAHEASLLADEVARLDLAACSGAQGLDVAAWRALSPARRSNALRAWLRRTLGSAAPQTLVQRLLEELQPSRTARSARWPTPGAVLGLHRGVLSLVPPAMAPVPGDSPAPLDLRHPRRIVLPPWRGSLLVEAAAEGGVPTAQLAGLLLRVRSGGERFRPAPGAPSRSLKKQFQARGVPAWARAAPLLVDAQDRIVFVPGLGIDAAFQAAPGVDQCRLQWLPD